MIPLKIVTLREMTIPRNVDDGAEPNRKKRGGIAPFHKLFWCSSEQEEGFYTVKNAF